MKIQNLKNILLIFGPILSLCWPLETSAEQTVHQLFVFNCPESGTSSNQPKSCPMGGVPTKLMESSDGDFYGTTELGGTGDKAAGTVFRLTPTGQLTTIYTFVADSSGNYPNGANPGEVVEGVDGLLYGSTVAGGRNGTGVIFKLSKTGTFEVLHVGGASHLTFGRDGNLYGIGADNSGNTALARITPDGSYLVLHTFEPKVDGIYPAGLILTSDGNICGTTVDIEAFRITSLFCLTPADQFTILQSVHYGQFLTSPPIQSEDGNLYAALDFVVQGNGSLPPGVLQREPSGSAFHEITLPYAPQQWMQEILEASDGNFWGSSSELGAIVSFTHGGTGLQQIDLGGYSLMQASDGRILGESANEIFALEPALPAPKPLFIAPSASGGMPGSKINIYGSHLLGATHVTFNGVDAAFKVLNSGTILATVPTGATTGLIAVTNPGGMSESVQDFVIQ